MKNISLWLAAAACLCVPSGCIQENVAALDDDQSVSVTMRVQTRADGSGMQASTEDAIKSLRVYAYWAGKQIGYYYAPTVQTTTTADNKEVVTFIMDLDLPSFSTINGNVNFYLVANENAVTPYQPTGDFFSETMTETDLINRRFSAFATNADCLPMAIIHSATITPTDVKESTSTDPSTGTDHTGHWMLNQTIEFELERSIGKLGMFFAKRHDAEGGSLVINRIVVLPESLRDYNYIFSPTPEMLAGVTHSRTFSEIPLLTSDMEVTKVMTDESYNSYTLPTTAEGVSQLSTDFDDALATPAYMFENCYGSENANTWGTSDTDHKGFVLRVTYTVNGNQSTKDIYLPPIERNTYYYVLNRIGIDGAVSLVYSVDEWEQGGTSDIGFGHPDFTFKANVVEEVDGTEYCSISYDPYNHGTADAEGVSFIFHMSKPAGQVWSASIDNAEMFTLWIDGKQATGDDIEVPQMTADDKDHVLKITANYPDVDYTDYTDEEKKQFQTSLTIKTVMWGKENEKIVINENSPFPGTPDAILITQQSATAVEEDTNDTNP